MFPSHEAAASILSNLGKPVACSDEREMKPLVSVTGHISSFFLLMQTTQEFLESKGDLAQNVPWHELVH